MVSGGSLPGNLNANVLDKLLLLLGLTTLFNILVISVASDIEREKSGKFCSEALISACASFMCRKSMTRDPRL